MIQHPRVLISTIQPSSGGVPAKVLWVIGELQSLGLVPVVAWYEPWSRTPILSVPAHALASFRRPGVRTEPVFGDVEGHGLGAWLPELEFTHYRPCRDWRQLIGSCQFHLAVTGNPLCAFRFTALELPFLAWVGTPWEGDRVDRVRTFPLPRRLLDQGLNAPVLRRMERKVLQDPRGRILAISQVTADALEEIGGRPMDGVLYLPPDASLFHPLPQKLVPWRIGFSGRYSDPRKQIELLLAAVRHLADLGHPVQLELTGERDGSFLDSQLQALGISDRVRCHPYLSPSELAAVIQRWEVFVIPSHQEGLCIAGLEAMACGVPVVSTRCGGPEDFVLEGLTGSLVDADPHAMAAAIARICSDHSLQQRLSEGARDWVAAKASENVGRTIFRRHLEATFPFLINIL